MSDAETRKSELLNRLLEIRDEDPALFASVVNFDLPEHYEAERESAQQTYINRITQAWKRPAPIRKSQRASRGRGRGDRTAYPRVIEEVWLHVSFLSWRDNRGIKATCEKLAYEHFWVLVRDTETGDIDNDNDNDQTPMLLIYPGGKGGDPGNNIYRKFYCEFKKLGYGRQYSAQYALKNYKRGYNGEVSYLTRERIDRIFAPKDPPTGD